MTQVPQQRQAQGQKCGIVFGYGALEVVPQDAGSPQAEACFWQAFQHCRPATLVFNSGGIGKGIAGKRVIRTFTIYKVNGTCVISDTRQESTSPNALSPATTYTCTGLLQHPRALDFIGCGRDGTIEVLGA
ncbi:MAG: hypothetical protein H0W02_08815 [Ktedonobacteraceae bacterium]|nr:hypothetical protein [Ktedonobacteraceae bacterium]